METFHIRIHTRKEYIQEKKPCDIDRVVLSEVVSKQILSKNNTPEHMLIEGDNYHALSILTQTHHESIDLIYIDPPYNTGNAQAFMYTDKYNHHSVWLSFMEKRLTLAYTLLKSTGAISFLLMIMMWLN
jgi:adenine-specific DNA-methyltransferase